MPWHPYSLAIFSNKSLFPDTFQLSRGLIPDIPAILLAARDGRVNMVQTPDQYAFIFEAAIAKLQSSEWTAHGEDGAPSEELSRV